MHPDNLTLHSCVFIWWNNNKHTQCYDNMRMWWWFCHHSDLLPFTSSPNTLRPHQAGFSALRSSDLLLADHLYPTDVDYVTWTNQMQTTEHQLVFPKAKLSNECFLPLCLLIQLLKYGLFVKVSWCQICQDAVNLKQKLLHSLLVVVSDMDHSHNRHCQQLSALTPVGQ